MTQKPRRWTPDEDDTIRRLHGQGESRNAIAKQIGVSPDTLSRRARLLGLAFDTSRTREGVEARSLDLRAKRQLLAELQLEQAVRMARSAGSPYKITFLAGGEWRERTVDEPPARDQRDFANGSSQLAASAMRLIEFDRGSAGVDGARSMLGALMSALAGHVGDEPADDGDGQDDDRDEAP